MYPKTYFEQNQPNQKYGHCFVMMPFAPHFDEVYETIAGAIEGQELNYTCVRADELFGGGHIIEDILRLIGEADIIIADLTTKNPNVFYELGITHTVKALEKVLIITQDMDDVPFDLRHYRCIQYTQNTTGFRALQRDLISAIKSVSGSIYRFAVRDGDSYRFPNKLFGPDRSSYDFEFTETMVGDEWAKFKMKEYRHAIGKDAILIREKIYGVQNGETIDLYHIPWQLELEEARSNTAFFRVVKMPGNEG